MSALCRELPKQNEAFANLFVAKHRLHASLDTPEIMGIITEIPVELVGAEKCAILFLEKTMNMLRRVAGQGSPNRSEAVNVGERLLGKVAADGKPFYANSIAVIPLKANATTIGLIAVHQLLPHKTTFTSLEHQLLELVADHAPQALLSARLHRMSRKRRT